MLKKMNHLHFQKKQLKLAAFLFSVLMGALYANWVIVNDLDTYQLVIDFFVGRIRSNTIIKTDLLEYLIFTRFKMLMILWLVGFILFTPIINRGFIVLIGFCYGVIFSAAFIMNGFSGYILFFLLLFPQIFVYVPTFLFLCSKNEEFSKTIYHNRKSVRGFKVGGQTLVEYFLVLAIASVFLILGIYLEAFINSDIIQWYLHT